MKITQVRISLSKRGNVRALASIVFDDCFAVSGIRTVQTKAGLLVAMRTRPQGTATPQHRSSPALNRRDPSLMDILRRRS